MSDETKHERILKALLRKATILDREIKHEELAGHHTDVHLPLVSASRASGYLVEYLSGAIAGFERMKRPLSRADLGVPLPDWIDEGGDA